MAGQDVGHRKGRPGADSRTWVSYGTVLGGGSFAPSFIDGMYCGWVVLPHMGRIPVRFYNGPRGVHVPVTVGEQVLVVVPDGNPKSFAVAFPGVQSLGDVAPGKVRGEPEKVWVYGEGAVHIYGAEKVIVESAQEVHLGKECSTEFSPGVGSDGVVTGKAICPYTGQPHMGASPRVFATIDPPEEE